MNKNRYREEKFTAFLDKLLNDAEYASVVRTLSRPVEDAFYEGANWYGLEELLKSFPEATQALRGFAFEGWDVDVGGFSSGNLKACYVPDEDFVNGGRAFVLFNLVASNWTYVGQAANQLELWEVRKR